MKMSDQFHAPAALPPGRGPVPIKHESRPGQVFQPRTLKPVAESLYRLATPAPVVQNNLGFSLHLIENDVPLDSYTFIIIL
jgi:hypothetical protein